MNFFEFTVKTQRVLTLEWNRQSQRCWRRRQWQVWRHERRQTTWSRARQTATRTMRTRSRARCQPLTRTWSFHITCGWSHCKTSRKWVSKLIFLNNNLNEKGKPNNSRTLNQPTVVLPGLGGAATILRRSRANSRSFATITFTAATPGERAQY